MFIYYSTHFHFVKFFWDVILIYCQGTGSTSSSYEYNSTPLSTYAPPVLDTRPAIDYESLLRGKDEEVTKSQQEVKGVKAEMKKQQTRMSILEQTNKILLQEKDTFDQSKRRLTQEIEELKVKVRWRWFIIE